MQCGELMYRRATIMTQGSGSTDKMPQKSVIKETIHSGHFMVSDFEAEAQDDEDLVAVPVPDEESRPTIITPTNQSVVFRTLGDRTDKNRGDQKVSLFIDSSLTKLFQCMTVAYRQKLTSPKWNRFKGIRIRWKDKIRLNNVIWRCWHMQFIRRENTLVCQFASPLDVDMHNKPEAVVLEGKYWKRKLATVTAEYKKWRMFYKNKIMGWTAKEGADVLGDIDMFEWQPNSNDSSHSMGSMMVDEDYMDLMSDTLFSTISQQPFPFPNPREIARGAGIADFIQPGLVQLQPNLDDFMDTLEPLQSLHDLLYPKLASVPEETTEDNSMYRPVAPSTLDANLVQQAPGGSIVPPSYSGLPLVAPPPQQQQQSHEPSLQYTAKIYTQSQPPSSYIVQNTVRQQALAERATGVAPYYFTAQGSMMTHESIPPTPPPQPLQLQLQNQPSLQLMPESLSPAPTEKNCSSATVAKSDEVFAFPHVHKMKRRSHSGSSLLSSSSQRALAPSTHQPMAAQQPLSISSSGLNLMSSENSSSTLLAQLLQPSTSGSAATTSAGSYHHMKPILPAPAKPSQPLSPQHQSMPATVLVTPTLTASSSVTAKSAQNPDLIQPRPQPLVGSHALVSPSARVEQQLATGGGSVGGGGGGPSVAAAASFGLASPALSPPKPFRAKSDQERTHYKEMRRVCHINAEQKRRCNIQNGFQTLQGLIPHLSQSPSSKLSKAALLHKGADYIRQLRDERSQLKDEIGTLKAEIEALNSSISNVQALLPASGAPVSHQRSTRMKEMFDEYTRVRTQHNWKFWIFSVLMQPLLASYSTSVSTSSIEDMCRSILQWVEQRCSLVDLRPVVLNALRRLCTNTDILTDPARLPEQALQAVGGSPSQQQQQQLGASSGVPHPSPGLGTVSPSSPTAGPSYSLH